ncbi:MAG TPA: hypothetical protein DDW52_22675 [Planctomycetaceae bacterium]|nr:hypothetical protein [Planctomycetaceae bacterium]
MLFKTKSKATTNTVPKPAVEASALESELNYWEQCLSASFGDDGLELAPEQRDRTLVPSLEDIQTIQSKSKANPLVFLSSGMQASVYYLEELKRAGFAPSKFSRVLEFGVGFARILRQFQPLDAELHGCDVTPGVIEWCKGNLGGLGQFLVSDFDPPLPYPDGHFDFIFANSVFTHLQHEQTLAWITELRRVVRKGGAVITTHYDINEHLRGFAASELHRVWAEKGYFEWGDRSVRENNICYSPELLSQIWSEHFEVLERRQYPLEQTHLVCRAL